MGETSIQTTPSPAPKPSSVVPSDAAIETRLVKHPGWFKKSLLALASLRLTVALFVLAVILVFCGTLAQIDADVWSVVNRYFRSAYVWIPFQIFFPRPENPKASHIPGGFPFPGGWLIGGALLVNLVAAHAVRFRYNFIGSNLPQTGLKLLKRSGILLIHSGLIVMMVGELLTGLFAVEAFMSIETGKSSNYVEDQRHAELAVISPLDAENDGVVAIPATLLKKGKTIQQEDLPFDVEVVSYLANSDIVDAVPAGQKNPATKGIGLEAFAVEKQATSGVDPEQKMELASAYLKLKNKETGEDLGTYLISQGLIPEKINIGDKEVKVSLRNKRLYKPYTVSLQQFHHGVYPGTDIPNDFTSLVRLEDPTRGEERNVKIYMNHPLRYEGDTFYQADILKGPGGMEKGTILQVVRNPGFAMPYLSCLMVASGMLVHFGIHLVGFLRRRAV